MKLRHPISLYSAIKQKIGATLFQFVSEYTLEKLAISHFSSTLLNDKIRVKNKAS